MDKLCFNQKEAMCVELNGSSFENKSLFRNKLLNKWLLRLWIMIFLPLSFITLGSQNAVAQNPATYPKVDKLTIYFPKWAANLHIENEDLTRIKKLKKDSLLFWMVNDLKSMIDFCKSTSPPLRFEYRGNSISSGNVQFRYVKLDSSYTESNRFVNPKSHREEFSSFKYKLELKLGGGNKKTSSSDFTPAFAINISPKYNNEKPRIIHVLAMYEADKYEIRDSRSKSGRIILETRNEKYLDSLKNVNIDSLINCSIDSLMSCKIPKRFDKAVTLVYENNEAPLKKAGTMVTISKGSNSNINTNIETFQLSRDYWYLTEGFGLSNVAKEWVPTAHVKIMRGFVNKSGINHEIGLSSTCYIDTKPDDKYHLDFNVFVSFAYRHVYAPTNRSMGIDLGYLVNRQGILFPKNTLRLGVQYPVSNKFSLNLAIFDNVPFSFKKEDQDAGMIEVGFMVWIP